ncbi:MAG: hypothetical protein IPO63_16045 [Bacteroidetes bacterium]|nr:hypothetical protein [Bacteroidota bacterium]
MKKLIPLIISFFFLIGCADEPIVQHSSYFSISSFLNEEIKQHQKLKTRLEKEVIRDEVKESKRIESPSWEHELKPFFESDIDKPAWHLAYECDTVQTDSLLQIVYVAKDEKAPVRRMQIDYLAKQIQKIEIQFEKTNPWFSLKRKLIYHHRIGYQIEGEQHMVLSDPSRFAINVKFIEFIPKK